MWSRVGQGVARRSKASGSIPPKSFSSTKRGPKTNMTRTYGRSELGTRLVQKTPCGRWADDDLPQAPCGPKVSSLRSRWKAASTANCSRAGSSSIWAPVFENPADLVVMDNLSSHKVGRGFARPSKPRGRRVALLASLLAGCESDRFGFLHVQEMAPRRRGTNRRQTLETLWHHPRPVHRIRVPKLLQTLRIPPHLK